MDLGVGGLEFEGAAKGCGRLFEMPPPLFDMPPPVEVPKPAKNKAAKAVSPADTSEDLSAAALSSGDTPDATQNIQAQNEESSDAASQDAAIPSAATRFIILLSISPLPAITNRTLSYF